MVYYFTHVLASLIHAITHADCFLATPDMGIARQFSRQNGFGFMPTYSVDSPDINKRIAAELHSLLQKMIAAEEVAI